MTLMIERVLVVFALLSVAGCEPAAEPPPASASETLDARSEAEGWARDLARGLATLGIPWTELSEGQRTHRALQAQAFLNGTAGRAAAVRLRLTRGGREIPVYAVWNGGHSVEGECAIPQDTIRGRGHVEVVLNVGGSANDPPFDVTVDVYYGR